MGIHRIVTEPVSIGTRGQHYSVHHDGTLLLASTRLPEFDAARALQAKGLSGRLEVWRKGANHLAMFLDIQKAAALSIEESDKTGPRITRWQPRLEGVGENAISTIGSTSGVSARTGADHFPVGSPPTNGSAEIHPPARPILPPSPA
jgi:hypothetical protein